MIRRQMNNTSCIDIVIVDVLDSSLVHGVFSESTAFG